MEVSLGLKPGDEAVTTEEDFGFPSGTLVIIREELRSSRGYQVFVKGKTGYSLFYLYNELRKATPLDKVMK